MLQATPRESHAQTQSPTLLTKWRMAMAANADAELIPSELRLMLRLLDHYNLTTGRCDPSYSTLAVAIGITRKNAILAAQGLERKRWIAIKRAGRTSNLFVILWGRAGVVHDTTLVSPATPPSVAHDTSASVAHDTLNREVETAKGNESAGTRLNPFDGLSPAAQKERTSAGPVERVAVAGAGLVQLDDVPAETLAMIRAETPYGDERLAALFADCRQWHGERGKLCTPFNFRKWCEREWRGDQQEAARARGKPRGAVETAIAGLQGYVVDGGAR